MTNPKFRFPDYTDEWQEHSVGNMTRELHEYNTLESGIPLMTSSRNGIMLQSDYRGSITTDSEDAQFSVVHRGNCTYRHMSDDDIFHFNINTIADVGLVSKEYPVFECVDGNSLPLLVEFLNSSKRFLKFCREQKMGGTRTRLYYNRLCEFSFPFPSVKEQTQMACFFDRINETVTNQEQYVAVLETQKKELLRQVFAREIRFKDENGQDYPEWKYVPLESIAGEYKNSIVDGPFGSNLKSNDYTNSGVLVMQSNYVTSGNFNIVNPFYISEEKAWQLRRCSVKSGDILMAKIGARFGSCAIVPSGYDNARLSSNTLKIDLNQHHLNKLYAYYLMYLYYSDAHFKTVGINAQPALSLKYIKCLQVPDISLPEQQRIADFFTALDAQIENERALLEDWRQLKKGLLQQMFI